MALGRADLCHVLRGSVAVSLGEAVLPSLCPGPEPFKVQSRADWEPAPGTQLSLGRGRERGEAAQAGAPLGAGALRVAVGDDAKGEFSPPLNTPCPRGCAQQGHGAMCGAASAQGRECPQQTQCSRELPHCWDLRITPSPQPGRALALLTAMVPVDMCWLRRKH